MPYTDYVYPGSEWANASPDKVWILLARYGEPPIEWPVPAKFEVNKEFVDLISRQDPALVYNKYVVRMGSDDKGGWLTASQATWLRNSLFRRIILQTNLLRGNRQSPDDTLEDDMWASGVSVFIQGPLRIWPVDWGGQYYHYDVTLVTPFYC